LNDVVASNNGDDGVYVDVGAYASGAGSATFVMQDVVASENSGAGINAVSCASSNYGTASFSMQRVTANGNLGSGISLDSGAAVMNGSSAADFTMDTITVSGNSGRGISMRLCASATEGQASVAIRNVTASENLDYGIFMTACAYSGSNASLDLENIVTSDNQMGGLDIDSGATSYFSSGAIASFTMLDVRAERNVGTGVTITGGAIGILSGNATTTLKDVIASGNSSFGMELWNLADAGWLYSSCDSTAKLENITASDNGAAGLQAYECAQTYTGLATFEMKNSETLRNVNSGVNFLYAAARSDWGTAAASFTGNNSSLNGGWGFYFADAPARVGTATFDATWAGNTIIGNSLGAKNWP